MRDVPSGVAELKYRVDRDPNLVGVYISPQAPGGKLLDNPDFHPLYDAAQADAWRHPMAPAHAISTVRGSCCTVAAIRGLEWRRWAPSKTCLTH
jgi:hypothetical protein